MNIFDIKKIKVFKNLAIMALFLTLGLYSCSDFSEENSDLFGNTINSENDADFIDIPIEIDLNKVTTRFLSEYETSTGPDGLPVHTENIDNFDFYIGINYDDIILLKSTKFWQSTGFIDHLNKPELYEDYIYFVRNCSKSGSKLTLTLRFNRLLDPSKIEMYFMGTGSSWPALNSDPMRITNLMQSACCFFSHQKLSGDSSWSNIVKTFTLKRLNAEFIVLVPPEVFINDYQKKFPDWEDLYLSANYKIALNWETGASAYDGEFLQGSGYNYCTYNIKDDRVNIAFDKADNMGYYRGASWSLGEGSNYSEKFQNSLCQYNIKYKNKEYIWMICSCLASLKPSFPTVSDKPWGSGNKPGDSNGDPGTGRELKYLTALVDQTVYISDKGRLSRYGSIPLPSSGIQANKRYVFVLKDTSHIFTTDYLNTTRSSEDEINGIIPESDFDLIVQDMDEPLPFELYEN